MSEHGAGNGLIRIRWGATRRLGALLASVALALAACKNPKYVRYYSEFGDARFEVPYAWNVYLDKEGSRYYGYTFVGPFDPEFFHGLPTLGVRWYTHGHRRPLRGGRTESYSSAADFMDQMLREVYGPERVLIQEPHKVDVAGWEGHHFVVASPADVPPSTEYGAYREEGGTRTVVLRQHAYAVLPMKTGFYVFVYPATRAGYDRYADRFNHLVNSFRVVKEGPAGPRVY